MSRIQQSGRMSLRRPKPQIKGGSAPEEDEEKNVFKRVIKEASTNYVMNNCVLTEQRNLNFFPHFVMHY